ncbi:MAG: hypothetical protein QOE63_1703, partial [Acidimicrobiaceae bacterium]
MKRQTLRGSRRAVARAAGAIDGRRATDVRGRRKAVDPRRLVAVGAVAALLVLVALTVALEGAANRAQDSVIYIRTAMDAPRGHLEETLEALTAGESLLQRAAVTTGAERNGLLSESINSGEAATKAWANYRAVALHLAGEGELAAAYDRDQA